MKVWITGWCNIAIVGISLCFLNLIASEDVPEDPNGQNEPKEQVEIVTPSSSSNDNDNSIAALDETKCMKSRNGCCDELSIGDEQSLMKCFALHQSKIPPENDSDPVKLMKFLSCFVECIYKQKKYLGKGDNINMKMVKSDAEKTYADRPKEKEYHIGMYEFCRKDALTMYGVIKMNPAAKFMLRDACKPFFMFVFLCTADYHRKHSCPYHRWEGKSKTPQEKECLAAKNKCYEIDGIVI